MIVLQLSADGIWDGRRNSRCSLGLAGLAESGRVIRFFSVLEGTGYDPEVYHSKIV